jgi:hypothetical protein
MMTVTLVDRGWSIPRGPGRWPSGCKAPAVQHLPGNLALHMALAATLIVPSPRSRESPDRPRGQPVTLPRVWRLARRRRLSRSRAGAAVRLLRCMVVGSLGFATVLAAGRRPRRFGIVLTDARADAATPGVPTLTLGLVRRI